MVNKYGAGQWLRAPSWPQLVLVTMVTVCIVKRSDSVGVASLRSSCRHVSGASKLGYLWADPSLSLLDPSSLPTLPNQACCVCLCHFPEPLNLYLLSDHSLRTCPTAYKAFANCACLLYHRCSAPCIAFPPQRPPLSPESPPRVLQSELFFPVPFVQSKHMCLCVSNFPKRGDNFCPCFRLLIPWQLGVSYILLNSHFPVSITVL